MGDIESACNQARIFIKQHYMISESEVISSDDYEDPTIVVKIFVQGILTEANEYMAFLRTIRSKIPRHYRIMFETQFML